MGVQVPLGHMLTYMPIAHARGRTCRPGRRRPGGPCPPRLVSSAYFTTGGRTRPRRTWSVIFIMSGPKPNSWERREQLPGPVPVRVRLQLPHGHHAGVRAGRPGDQAVDVLERVGLGDNLTEVVDRVTGCGGDVKVGHGVLPFGHVSLDRTDVAGGRAIGRILMRGPHSGASAAGALDQTAIWLRSAKPSWSGCAGRGSARCV